MTFGLFLIVKIWLLTKKLIVINHRNETNEVILKKHQSKFLDFKIPVTNKADITLKRAKN